MDGWMRIRKIRIIKVIVCSICIRLWLSVRTVGNSSYNRLKYEIDQLQFIMVVRDLAPDRDLFLLRHWPVLH